MRYLRLGWRNGVPYNEHYGDVYFSEEGGLEESRHVFIDGNQIESRFESAKHITIFETGFGTGLNFLLTVQSFLRCADETASLDFLSVEQHPIHPRDLKQVYERHPELSTLARELLAGYPEAITGMHRCSMGKGRVRLTLYIGDIQQAMDELECMVDAWYLDGFSPAKNDAMWSQRLFTRMAELSSVDATLSTYTVAGAVRRGLQSAGFSIEKNKGYGRKREMLIGRLDKPTEHRSTRPWFSLPSDPALVCIGENTNEGLGGRHAAVVGAGIAGLTTAYHLVKRGWRVTLIDRQDVIASGASGNPAAIMMPRLSIDDPVDNQFYIQAALYARQQYASLQLDHDEPFWFDSGVITGMSAARAESLCDSHHAAADLLTEIHTPYLSNEFSWRECRHAGWLRPKVLCEAILSTCGDSIELVQETVASFRSDAAKVELFAGDASPIIEAGVVVFCNADGIKAMSEFDHLPIRSSRGQVTRLSGTEVSGAVSQPVSATAYCTPLYQGYSYTGASYSAEQKTELSPSDQRANIENINLLVPGYAEQSDELAGRVSFRATSEDRVPIVGAAPDVDYYHREYADLCHGKAATGYKAARYLRGVYLNVAHGSRGFTSSMLSAEMLASMITATPLPVSKQVADHLHPARFVVRSLRRNRQQVCAE